ncbi:cupin domain-containing protein [Acidobacteria bacterium AH-259-G07]|nr:cupin domain-containing protein [Acidobacteria bacterium AH-259-G07]
MKARKSLYVLLAVKTVFMCSLGKAQHYDQPTHIPFQETTRVLWGDETSGKVHDSFYFMSDNIYQLIYGMAPGEVFRHSDRFPTLFATDAVYYVLSGTLLLNNPETGEVQRVNQGEAGFLRRNKWNYGFSYGAEPLRVLEFYIPPRSEPSPAEKPELSSPKYTQDQWIGRWPDSQQEAHRNFSTKVVRESDILWRLEGGKNQVLVGILVSTDHVTVGRIKLLPGRETDIRTHGGDAGLYLLEGALHVRLPEDKVDERGQTRWFDVKPGDGVYLPAGTRHQYYNPSDRPCTLIFGVSPRYLP